MDSRACGQTIVCHLDDASEAEVGLDVDPLPPDADERFLGGRGFGVALVSRLGVPALDPLHPSQPFVVAAGPLTGTSAPSSGRFAVVAPSPLTGTIFDGNAGGRFGVRLRAAGLTALALLGRAPEWSVVVVDGRRGVAGDGPPRPRVVPLRTLLPGVDPEEDDLLWSRSVKALRGALGPAFSLLLPSVAGRRGALLGSLRTDDGRNLGRGGLGAALSAKRIFAVAVAGDRPIEVAEPDRFSFLVYEAEKQVCANPVTSRALPEFGTAVLMRLVHAAGALPVRNYSSAWWEGVDRICGEATRDSIVAGRRGCFGCRIRCTPRVGGGREGPEYETLWAFGADVGVDDPAVIQEANRLCGEYGLDTISTGATIACAMELSEAGVLGRDVRFGDRERLVRLVEEMGRGIGFGRELQDGSARFADAYGHPEAAMHVKGLELPAYDPRGMHGQGLAYATSNRGACHLRGNMLGPEILGIPKMLDRFSIAGKSGILLNLQHLGVAFDSLSLCKFAGFAFGEEVLSRLYSAATGRRVAAQDLLRAGERVWNLERLWNLAAGFDAADDTLPARVLHTPLPDGPAAGRTVDLEPMLAEYYRARGWDALGVPTATKVEELGLGAEAAALATGGRAADAGRPPWQGWRLGSALSDEEGGRHLRAVP